MDQEKIPLSILFPISNNSWEEIDKQYFERDGSFQKRINKYLLPFVVIIGLSLLMMGISLAIGQFRIIKYMLYLLSIELPLIVIVVLILFYEPLLEHAKYLRRTYKLYYGFFSLLSIYMIFIALLISTPVLFIDMFGEVLCSFSIIVCIIAIITCVIGKFVDMWRIAYNNSFR